MICCASSILDGKDVVYSVGGRAGALLITHDTQGVGYFGVVP